MAKELGGAAALLKTKSGGTTLPQCSQDQTTAERPVWSTAGPGWAVRHSTSAMMAPAQHTLFKTAVTWHGLLCHSAHWCPWCCQELHAADQTWMAVLTESTNIALHC